MKFIKKHLCDLTFCYAVSCIQQDGRTKFLMAPDALGPCYSVDRETFEQLTIWEAPSGTMAFVPLPGKNGDFLAVQGFNPGFQAQDASIVYAHHEAGKWQVDTLFKLPYVHRFDILRRAGVDYLVCCTVCTTKAFQDDWSSPGQIYAAPLPEDLSQPISLVSIAGGMNRNHGFWRVQHQDDISALTSCDQGVFKVLPPARRGGEWTVSRVLERAASDIALSDIDGDGRMELATIEPFHGNKFAVYHESAEGYVPIYEYPRKTDFCHVVWGGQLRGESVFIGGCRAENQELFLLRYKNGVISHEIIESGHGPSNVAVINGPARDLIVVANREKGEGALFVVEDD